MKRNWKEWLKAAGIRAARTFGQAFISTIPTTAISVGEVKWGIVIGAAALAAILSLATSLAGLPELEDNNKDGEAVG